MWGLIISASSVVAQFRRGFSTTSALTYPFPPRTAVIGMIGAILGANKKTVEGRNLLKKLDKELRIGVRWVKGRVTTFGINNMYGKKEGDIQNVLPNVAVWAKEKGRGSVVHLPTPMEFIICPEYEIAVLSGNKHSVDSIEDAIKNREMAYAPYLGVHGALARLDVVTGVTKAEKMESEALTNYTAPEESAEVCTLRSTFVAVVPQARDYSDRLRRVTKYSRVYWATPGENLKIEPKGGVWKLNDQAIPIY